MDKYLEVMKAANDLIHAFRNNPESIINNAKQVDPVIRNLRIAIYEIEQKNKTEDRWTQAEIDDSRKQAEEWEKFFNDRNKTEDNL